jgi:hypothetical protein
MYLYLVLMAINGHSLRISVYSTIAYLVNQKQLMVERSFVAPSHLKIPIVVNFSSWALLIQLVPGIIRS